MSMLLKCAKHSSNNVQKQRPKTHISIVIQSNIFLDTLLARHMFTQSWSWNQETVELRNGSKNPFWYRTKKGLQEPFGSIWYYISPFGLGPFKSRLLRSAVRLPTRAFYIESGHWVSILNRSTVNMFFQTYYCHMIGKKQHPLTSHFVYPKFWR
jgi:hypothetical protein